MQGAVKELARTDWVKYDIFYAKKCFLKTFKLNVLGTQIESDNHSILNQE
jgi:hypothetical protein